MKHRTLLAQLLPPRSYDAKASQLSAELVAEGAALDGAQLQARLALDSVTPFEAVDTLQDWERICGIAPQAEATRAQRVDAVLAKLQELGGLSIPYFKGLAKRLGYEIEIIEYEPFYLDYSILDRDVLYDVDVIYVWQVSVSGGQVRSYPFCLDVSSVDERLLAISDAVIEAYISDLKPAHTFVIFDYRSNINESA